MGLYSAISVPATVWALELLSVHLQACKEGGMPTVEGASQIRATRSPVPQRPRARFRAAAACPAAASAIPGQKPYLKLRQPCKAALTPYSSGCGVC